MTPRTDPTRATTASIALDEPTTASSRARSDDSILAGWWLFLPATSTISARQVHERPASIYADVTTARVPREAHHRPESARDLDASMAVAEIRRLSGLTIQQIANLLGVSRRTIHAWSSGQPLNAENHAKLLRVQELIRDVYRGTAASTRTALLRPIHGETAFDRIREGRYAEARELLTSSRGHRSRAIRRLPPSKKVLDERRPLAPWILLTKDPEPSPAPPEEGRSEKASRSERRGGK